MVSKERPCSKGLSFLYYDFFSNICAYKPRSAETIGWISDPPMPLSGFADHVGKGDRKKDSGCDSRKNRHRAKNNLA